MFKNSRFEELSERISALEINALEKENDKLENEKDLQARVAYALQQVLDTNQAITIRHFIDDKEVTTKLLRNEVKDLHRKRSDLERLLDAIDKQLSELEPSEQSKDGEN